MDNAGPVTDNPSMLLILFRHGIAEDRRHDLDDADRRLTPLGIERTSLATRGLAATYPGIDRILTSPKRRARETAGLLGEAVGRDVELCEPLAEGAIDELLGVVRGLKNDVPVLVGHEPMLSLLAERICGNDDGAGIELKKAGAIVMQVAPGQTRGVLKALLPPKVLRALAERDA